MKAASHLRCCALAATLLPAIALSQATDKLRLIQTIPIPTVQGRLDHLDVNPVSKRLYVAALESGSVEVMDLAAAKWQHSITGFKKPQGIAAISSLNKLFIASGDDGMLRIFRLDTGAPLASIQLEPGTNRVTYDPRTHFLYVGYGGKDAGHDYGQIAVIDARTDKRIADIRVSAHPAELLLDPTGHTLYAFISVLNQVHVIDTRTRQITATWPIASKGPGDAALDPAAHRLFIGTHQPPEMIVLDSSTGKQITNLPTGEGMDGVYFDAKHKRVYISCGRAANSGAVFVYQQRNPDHYDLIAQIPTRPGAGTSFWSPQLNRYFVAAPADGNTPAAILVFEPQP